MAMDETRAAESPHLPPTTSPVSAETGNPADGTVAQVSPSGFDQKPHVAMARQVPGFELLDELGRGGMGVVYKARQHGLGRVVALKMVLHGAHATAEELDRFRGEAEAIARLRHANIVEVYAYGETQEGLPYFALEFCAGGTLAQKCAEPVPLRDAAMVVQLLARAVHFAHEAGIVHRDLKPANVLLTGDGTPKITDFGLAKGLGGANSRTQTGAVLGTPSYMAPEQAAGRIADIGPATDVYALGAILYQLLTGRAPFEGAGVIETLQSVQRDDPTRPRRLRKDLPHDLEAVVLHCLEKAAGERYASAKELADDLSRWLSGSPVWAHRHSMLYRVRKRVIRRSRWIAAGAAAVLLLVAAWVLLADRGLAVPGGEWARRRLDRHELSLLRPAPTIEDLRSAGASQRIELARHALHAAPRKGGWLSGHMQAGRPFDRPDAWSQVQAIACLAAAPETPNDDLRPLVAVLHTEMFGKNPVCRAFDPNRGWSHFYDDQPATEACGWALSAVPTLIARPGLCTPGERELLLRRLDEIQGTLDLCHARDPLTGRETGRWNLVTQPTGDPPPGNIFTTTLVFQGLIELSRAGLPWRGDHARREELFRLTSDAIIEQFDGKGWLTRGRSAADLNDGLTLQLFALLLRAERYGLIELPERILAQIPRHLAECGTRDFEHPINTSVFDIAALGYKGEQLVIQRPVRFLWHPWATECAARWLARLNRTGAPHEEVVATRRILAHLVLTLWPQAEPGLKSGYAYVVFEGILGLCALNDLE